jgi:uncharacterized protein YjdB
MPIIVKTLVSSITVIPPSPLPTFRKGGRYQFRASVLPSTASLKTVRWTDNSAVVTVSTTGLVVVSTTATAGTSVTITATAADGSLVYGTYTFTI